MKMSSFNEILILLTKLVPLRNICNPEKRISKFILGVKGWNSNHQLINETILPFSKTEGSVERQMDKSLLKRQRQSYIFWHVFWWSPDVSCLSSGARRGPIFFCFGAPYTPLGSRVRDLELRSSWQKQSSRSSGFHGFLMKVLHNEGWIFFLGK